MLFRSLEFSYADLFNDPWKGFEAFSRIRFRASLRHVCRRWRVVLGAETDLVARGIKQMERRLEALEEVPERPESVRRLV